MTVRKRSQSAAAVSPLLLPTDLGGFVVEDLKVNAGDHDAAGEVGGRFAAAAVLASNPAAATDVARAAVGLQPELGARHGDEDVLEVLRSAGGAAVAGAVGPVVVVALEGVLHAVGGSSPESVTAHLVFDLLGAAFVGVLRGLVARLAVQGAVGVFPVVCRELKEKVSWRRDLLLAGG